MINIREMISDPDFAQTFTVYRSTGFFVKGLWTEGTPTQIPMLGVVNVANAKELAQYPEGDRIKGGMIFHTTEELFVTRNDSSPGTSDKILWRGNLYKIYQVSAYVDYGYYKVMADRETGD